MATPAPHGHVPVLLAETADLLAPVLAAPDPVVIDMTLGLGGHAAELLGRFPSLRLIGIDRDPEALARAGERLSGFGDRFTAVRATYDDVLDITRKVIGHPVTAVLADLGISSLQVDDDDRGFSYARDVALDMRMDPTAGPSAADVVNEYSEPELVRILRDYGEERFARRIARQIIAARADGPIRRSAHLVEVVREALPVAARGPGNPAKRVFQAVRIEVNAELTILERALPAAVECLAVGGRIVVLAYHSLEDRLVKRTFARGATSSAPPGLPVEPATHRPYLRLLTRGAVTASPDEIAQNPRSASVRLRAAERLRPTPEHLNPARWAA